MGHTGKFGRFFFENGTILKIPSKISPPLNFDKFDKKL